MMKNTFYEFLPDGITFRSVKAAQIRTIYAPLCGCSSDSLKSSITPYLSGDMKIDKFRYLTKPVSTEDLRHSVRDFFVRVDGKGVCALSYPVAESDAQVEIGMLWQKLTKRFLKFGIEMEALNFIPSSGENVEIMRVTVRNMTSESLTITPTSSIPVFARSLANKHDHEHVTSLLNRCEQTSRGIVVTPTMRFNEEGHLPNAATYFVLGGDDQGQGPVGTFPTVESFLGDDGTWDRPRAVFDDLTPATLTREQIDGKENAGALRFASCAVEPDETRTFFLICGIADNPKDTDRIFSRFDSVEKIQDAFAATEKFWKAKSCSITFHSGIADFNSWMHWVIIQPVLRRIFGCSFLPDHDYGKGGKGWRDLWQDLLSLILIEPEHVRANLINNFGGVRIDGSNATIIGDKPGEFIADRNAITRVWMDHGVWPFATTLLYIDQTGDFDLLLEQTSYFKDPQLSRTKEKDMMWDPAQGNALLDQYGKVYNGTILEHILLQNLVQFFNVGEHNITRLESADWNDGLDMAFKRGESVVFMNFYAGNLRDIADLLEVFCLKTGETDIVVAKEIATLLDRALGKSVDYDSAPDKQAHLKKYFDSVQPNVSGQKLTIALRDLVEDLRIKSQWMSGHIRKQEFLHVKTKDGEYRWFNGYYDNQGQRVEGNASERVRMTLTGQVFPLMSSVAQTDDIPQVIRSVQKFLRDKKFGGYRLNTDFGVPHYLDLGRAFGFAFGTKENGAFFSHMIVMYAFALYKRGFVHAGYEVLDSIFKMCMDTQHSKIYPGIPEYFDAQGRGMYHYLTGSASWFVLTQLTQVFGVRGFCGDLVIEPKLVKAQFADKTEISVVSQFAGKMIEVCYLNENDLDFGEYQIKDILCGQESLNPIERQPLKWVIDRQTVLSWPKDVKLKVILGPNR